MTYSLMYKSRLWESVPNKKKGLGERGERAQSSQMKGRIRSRRPIELYVYIHVYIHIYMNYVYIFSSRNLQGSGKTNEVKNTILRRGGVNDVVHRTTVVCDHCSCLLPS